MRQLESFFWGVIAALGALVIQIASLTAIGLVQNPYAKTTSTALLYTTGGIILAAFIEELFKYLVIFKRIEYLSLEKSFVINSLLVGLGFFTVELVLLHFKGIDLQKNLPVLAQVAVLHMSTAGAIGYRIAVANHRKLAPFVGTLIFVTAAHSVYNLLVNYPNVFTDFFIFTLLTGLVLLNIFNYFRISTKLAG